MAVTNRQMLIQGLQDTQQDEYTVSYIDCPYCRPSDCPNNHMGIEYAIIEYEANCTACKIAWLGKEFEG